MFGRAVTGLLLVATDSYVQVDGMRVEDEGGGKGVIAKGAGVAAHIRGG